jgi:hypothetical protein
VNAGSGVVAGAVALIKADEDVEPTLPFTV